MSRLLRFILILLVALIGLALAIPMLIPADTYRERIASEASTALDRQVVLNGDIRFSLLPRIGVTARDVAIANADGFGEDGEVQDDNAYACANPQCGWPLQPDTAATWHADGQDYCLDCIGHYYGHLDGTSWCAA